MTATLASAASPSKRSSGSPPRRLDGYAPIARAIDYLVAHHEEAPSLEETAAHAGLSAQHFQRIFKAGAGVSPKRFLQYLAAGNAKRALADGASVLDASFAAGLSGPSRLHDLFLVAEAMTPGAFRRKGEGLCIRYGVFNGPFGATLIGATDKGVAWLSFLNGDEEDAHINEMKGDWPAAEFTRDDAFVAPLAARAFAFAANEKLDQPLGLHVQGTNFQLKVWEALLKIPYGVCATYGDIARAVGAPRAARAVGSAVGANMISLLIPCHRVILSSGVIHNYRWGVGRKCAIIGLEQAILSHARA